MDESETKKKTENVMVSKFYCNDLLKQAKRMSNMWLMSGMLKMMPDIREDK